VFLDELRSLQPLWDDPWLLCDDFNLLYKSSDKSNSRLNRRLMGKFRRFLQDMEQSEHHLHDRLFTWSNEQVHPTLSRIDRAFVCIAWCDIFLHHHLCVGSSSNLDHAPLLLCSNVNEVAKQRFHFETIWPRFPGYLDVVVERGKVSCRTSMPSTLSIASCDALLMRSGVGVQNMWKHSPAASNG
jgi:hypothetical protein